MKNIIEKVPLNSDFTFDFERVNSERIAKLISELDTKKSGTFKGIPINVLKGSSDLCSSFLSEVWNEATIHLKQFLNKLKLAGVSQVFRIDDSTSVKNYRSVSVLPSTFERIMLNQINSLMGRFLSIHLCGYRKSLVLKQHFYHLLKNGKQYLTERDLVQLFLWIYLKHLTQLIVNCC